ncbi:MAG: hypothetical protein A3B91_04125 [Candidatus Yanofskybacteria bacterium RIFCSPHIGHO2_02_FULL_41_29]|uniref:PDZ domain-containing protein n=1 Tax=Candidatus Yanofskybacteria bacterium RIFCSPHIGHO2_01_FULL_41_53 TaxID=1802663 RepID=A0A1F8EFR3_9BACT|nr:MAG: hypothetical protein A2650_02840 [Candidatus Yanofskybacteria bacterium RIFCSPHIGHO2_01_FULL_41_53]OGN10488.1 MAG: hypothetical protein A3B91_04125 [Candidatus Yanofskybacteria bacterium RIFCSPHIGHO2_02_FULL_41_29]OGN21535.1 MAG: hypothetical protein A2916_04605 [Candidatus Yanofskybacteria bacterium RIFCSPLOWO2_01_FULL_41_67]OGN29675.1 MAG: hypothetical protein A3H54_02825 [Candidatus Yanofskybacteria bacterium RIFCSPLOWO2_02_FULL_41_13]OGN35817.1 MAG: hypothetical protein A3F98_03460 
MRRNVLLVIFLCLLAFNIGFGINIRRNQEKLDDFFRIMELVKAVYVEEKSDDELINLAMKGMVSGLDPYSHLFIGIEAGAVAEGFSRDKTYNEGVGISIGFFSDSIIVTEAFEGYSASNAGVKVGDRITKVDGKLVRGLTLGQVAGLIRGKEGTAVLIEFEDSHSKKTNTFSLVRQRIKVNSVVYKDLEGDNVYIKIRSFNSETKGEFFSSLLTAKSRSGLIIDIRDNMGGDLDTVVAMLGYILGPDKLVINTKGRASNDEFRTEKSASIPLEHPKKIVVLVNKMSASASEIMAGTLKHYKLATIIGTQTFGKGVAQFVINPDSSNKPPNESPRLLLVITSARYYLPDGSDINSIGISPDIEVNQADDFKGYEYLTAKDAQFQAALEFLRKNN